MQSLCGPAQLHRSSKIINCSRASGRVPGAFSRPLAAHSQPSTSGGSSSVCSPAVLQPSRRQTLGTLLLGSAGMWLGRGSSAIATAAAVSEKEKVLVEPKWPEKWPFRPEDFLRYDESDDSVFYDSPRFVYHIDDGATKALTEYYAQVFPPSGSDEIAMLDMCSSWVSHYPPGYKAGRIVALGMNEEELKANKEVTEYVVHDLNLEPALPFPDNSFDVITNAVSVDYLNKPLEVFQEIHRVLKPGGIAYMSFSNRCFPTKAIALWTATGDEDHIWIVGSYFHYSVPGGFEAPTAKDISPKGGLFGKSDPMYVVMARKSSSGSSGGSDSGSSSESAAGGAAGSTPAATA